MARDLGTQRACGESFTLQPVKAAKATFSRISMHTLKDSLCGQMLNGDRVDPKQLGRLPSVPASNITPADFSYSTTDQHRL